MNRRDRWKFLDKMRRKNFLKYELKKSLLSVIICNTKLPRTFRYYAIYNYSKISRSNSLVQHKNRCIKTGRIWSVVKPTKYSRFVFRNEVAYGNLPMFKRASW